jgi:hypothetical protein
MKVNVGKYHLFYNENNINNGILHVRAVVDGRFVCRRWHGHRRRWVYEVLPQCYFDVNAEFLT